MCEINPEEECVHGSLVYRKDSGSQKKLIKIGKNIPKPYWKWRIRQCYIDGVKVFNPEYIRNKWYYFWFYAYYFIDANDYKKYIADKASFRTKEAPIPGSYCERRIWFYSEEDARKAIDLMEQAHCEKIEMETQRLIYVKKPQ